MWLACYLLAQANLSVDSIKRILNISNVGVSCCKMAAQSTAIMGQDVRIELLPRFIGRWGVKRLF